MKNDKAREILENIPPEYRELVEDYGTMIAHGKRKQADALMQMMYDDQKDEIYDLKTYVNKEVDQELQRLYEWVSDENRQKANTKFTAGWLRNVAREIEYQIAKNKN